MDEFNPPNLAAGWPDPVEEIVTEHQAAASAAEQDNTSTAGPVPMLPTEPVDSVEIQDEPERLMSTEQIRDIFLGPDSHYSVSTAMNGSEIADENMPGNIRWGFMTVGKAGDSKQFQKLSEKLSIFQAASDKYGNNFQKRDSEHQRIIDSFEAAGVSEVVTIIPGDKNFAICYETTTAGREGKFRATSHDGRPGNLLRFATILPREQAQTFLHAAMQQPELVRESLDIVMRDGVGANKSWDGEQGVRPAYDEWRQANGGVAKMAFRNDLLKDASQSPIVEF